MPSASCNLTTDPISVDATPVSQSVFTARSILKSAVICEICGSITKIIFNRRLHRCSQIELLSRQCQRRQNSNDAKYLKIVNKHSIATKDADQPKDRDDRCRGMLVAIKSQSTRDFGPSLGSSFIILAKQHRNDTPED